MRRLAALAAAGLCMTGASVLADERSDGLIRKATERAAGFAAFDADAMLQFGSGAAAQTLSLQIKLLRPGFGRLVLKSADGSFSQTLLQDGKSFVILTDNTRSYTLEAAAKGFEKFPFRLPQFEPVFAPDRFAAGKDTRYVGKQTVGSGSYEVVEATSKNPKLAAKLYFGASGLVEGVEVDGPDDPSDGSLWLRRVKLDAALQPAQFAFRPPAGYRLLGQQELEKPLLAVGQRAPDFQLPQPGGAGELSLSGMLKGRKAVLVSFWLYG